LIHRALLETLNARVTLILESYHHQFPLRAGMPSEELRTTLDKQLDPRAYQSLMTPWQQTGFLASESGTVRLAAFRVELNERQSALLDRIAAIYREYGIAIPTITDGRRSVLRQGHPR
jgi:selenocysteine-specific elongation factor